MEVTAHTSVEAFFREVLLDALDEQHLDASDHTEHYLVGLLGEYAKARIPDEPLSLKLVGTQEPAARVKALKEVGDTSLYVVGFFAESLDRSLVDADYYIGLGEAAYSELSGRLARSHAAAVYRELAAKFPSFVEVLAQVRSRVAFVGSDVVELYREWQRTKADWIERRLRGLGVLLAETKDTLQ